MGTANTFVELGRGEEKTIADASDGMKAERARIALIEDNERLRQALAFQLSTANFHVIAFNSAEEFLEASDAGSFDCIVVDNFLPGMNGLQLQTQLSYTVPFASIVFISGNSELALGMHAMRKGAVDFLEKPLNDEALLSSIIRGVELTRTRRAERAHRIELEGRLGALTPREREVFALVTRGLLNKQVGVELGTTERTVKAHRERVMLKMKADSFAGLVRMSAILELQLAGARSGHTG